jgi:hypothetical protein
MAQIKFDHLGRIMIGHDRYSFASRQALHPDGTNSSIGASTTDEADAPGLVISLQRGQAARILIASALFTGDGSGKLIVQHALFQATISPQSGIIQVYAENGFAGGALASGGYGISLRDELFLNDDYKEFARSGTIQVTLYPIADVQNTDGAASHSVGADSWALWELYNLDSPALGALPRSRGNA